MRYHYIRDLVEKKRIQVKYCPTNVILANLMTKGLSRPKVEDYMRNLELLKFDKPFLLTIIVVLLRRNSEKTRRVGVLEMTFHLYSSYMKYLIPYFITSCLYFNMICSLFKG